MKSKKYIRGPSLAVFFTRLLQAGRSVSEMKALLDHQIRHGVITVVPSLPASWRLRPMGFDGLTIETADGYLNPGKFHCHYRARVPDWLKLPLPVQAAPTEAHHPSRLKAPAVRLDAKAKAELEAQAAEWLAGKPDLESVKRDHYEAEGMTNFPGLTKRAWDRILPAARKKAGLPEHAKRGPKKQTKR
jgi:hypothetical protein